MVYPVLDIVASGAATDASAGAQPGIDFYAALVSLLTAIVVTVGPSVMRKLLPPDPTLAEIAKNSTESVASSLDATLELVKTDFSALRTQISDNGKKIDKLIATRKGK